MSRLQNNAGFAMIDALLALLLFALVLLAAIAVLIQGMRATHAARTHRPRRGSGGGFPRGAPRRTA